VRLCDDCDLPFCTECLRKDLMGFYYCKWCYPALFKDTFGTKNMKSLLIKKDFWKIHPRIQTEVPENNNKIYKIIMQTILGGTCGFGLSFIMLLTRNYLLFPIITILGLMTGFIIASYKEKESKNIKILKQIITAVLMELYCFFHSNYKYITMPFRCRFIKLWFLLIVIPPITIFGMILGFILKSMMKLFDTTI